MASTDVYWNLSGETVVANVDDVEGDICGDGSIIKTIKTKGQQGTNPKNGDAITCHYVGTLLDGTKFDSSRDRSQPFNFTLGSGVITGWSEGVATMKKGEVADFEIQSHKAYGESGSPPKIPGGATLKFEIELISWESDGEKDVSKAKDGGVLKGVLQEGDGWEMPKTLAAVTCNYKFKVKDSDAIVLDTKGDGKPVEFVVGDGEVILGIEEAVQSMKKGEFANFTLSPKYGNVEEGKLQTLYGVVELVDFTNPQQAYKFTDEERIENCTTRRTEGNDFFKKGKYHQAMNRYTNAIDGIGAKFANSDDPLKAKAYEAVVPAYLNLAACQLKVNQNSKAKESCDKALTIEPDNVKGLYRKGCALTALGEWESATVPLKRALKIDSSNKAAAAALKKAKSLIAGQAAKERKMFGGMFDKMAKVDAEKEAKAKAKRDAELAEKGAIDICGDGSIIKIIKKEGEEGDSPKDGAQITCHYVGTLLDGTKFDSSRDRGDPFNFTLGSGVITGWSEGVATMKKGEVADFEIQSHKAYGASGSPPKIPGGATLKFEIELISWK